MKNKGRKFLKSTYSGSSNCVGISIEKNKVYVVNTKEKKTIIEFTYDEWDAFIKGVKNNEFEVNLKS